MLYWAGLLTSQRFDTLAANNVGVSSQTSPQILARAATTAALTAQAVVALFSTNDRGTLTAAQSLSNIAAWIAEMRAAGKVVFICDETPRTDLNGALLAEHVAVRDGIRAMHSPGTGVYAVRTWASIADSGDPDVADSDLLYDTVHPNPKGAAAMGAVLANVLLSAYPGRDVLTGGTNLITNGVMAGTAGTVAAPALGVAATSWTLNVRADLAPATATGSKVTEGGHDWQRVIVAGTPTFSTIPEARLLQNVATAGFAENDVVEILARLKINSVVGLRDLRFGILYGNGGASEAWDGSQLSAYDFSGGPWEGIIRTPRFTIPATNTLMRVQMSIQGYQNIAMAADVQVTDGVIRKL
jgi:lysophospholipase L1-like esterase